MKSLLPFLTSPLLHPTHLPNPSHPTSGTSYHLTKSAPGEIMPALMSPPTQDMPADSMAVEPGEVWWNWTGWLG